MLRGETECWNKSIVGVVFLPIISLLCAAIGMTLCTCRITHITDVIVHDNVLKQFPSLHIFQINMLMNLKQFLELFPLFDFSFISHVGSLWLVTRSYRSSLLLLCFCLMVCFLSDVCLCLHVRCYGNHFFPTWLIQERITEQVSFHYFNKICLLIAVQMGCVLKQTGRRK